MDLFYPNVLNRLDVCDSETEDMLNRIVWIGILIDRDVDCIDVLISSCDEWIDDMINLCDTW